jgi:hypothetical protein
MRKRRKEIDAALAFVCGVLREWDPIGVLPNTPGGPRDEYDSYAPHIVTLLRSGATQNQIADELERVRTQSIELPRFRRRDEEIAERLAVGWRKLDRGAHGV